MSSRMMLNVLKIIYEMKNFKLWEIFFYLIFLFVEIDSIKNTLFFCIHIGYYKKIEIEQDVADWQK